MNESKTLKTWGLLAVVLAVGLIMLGATSLWGEVYARKEPRALGT